VVKLKNVLNATIWSPSDFVSSHLVREQNLSLCMNIAVTLLIVKNVVKHKYFYLKLKEIWVERLKNVKAGKIQKQFMGHIFSA
jgi:hypothetical protein